MRPGWVRRKLGDLLSVQNGFAFDSSFFGPEGMPLIRIRDLEGGRTTETRYTGEYAPRFVVRAGDFLVSMDGEFACYEWKGEPALLNQRVCRLEELHHDLEPRFLLHGINIQLKSIEGATGYTTVKHLSSKQILGIEFQLPSREEQCRIVAILDAAFKGIDIAAANARENLLRARELYGSQLELLFSTLAGKWPERPLEQVAAITNGFAFKSTDFQAAPGVKSIKISNVGVRAFIDDGGDFLPASFAKRHSKFAVTQGSIVLALTRTIIAGGLKVAMVPSDFDGALLNQRVAAIQAHSSQLDSSFLFAYLSTRNVMKYVMARVNTLMQPNLSIADLRALPLPLPNVAQQLELVAALEGIERASRELESICSRKLAALDELKQSLLHQAFSGRLSS